MHEIGLTSYLYAVKPQIDSSQINSDTKFHIFLITTGTNDGYSPFVSELSGSFRVKRSSAVACAPRNYERSILIRRDLDRGIL
jgi:hypothetical protein